MKFEVLEHTGDVGLKFYGNSFEELISAAVEGTAHIMGTQPGRKNTVVTSFTLSFVRIYSLLVYNLSRMLFSFEVFSILYNKVNSLDITGDGNAVVSIEGYRVSSKFRYHYVIKAPTFHRLQLLPEKGFGTVVFDI